MPYVETVYELVEDLANRLGIYGPIPDGDHPEDCECRICFVESMTERIRAAVKNDVMFSKWGHDSEQPATERGA